MSGNKKIYWILLIVVALALVGFFGYRQYKTKHVLSSTATPAGPVAEQSPNTSVPPASGQTDAAPVNEPAKSAQQPPSEQPKKAAPSLTYDQALKLYTNRRIQFDNNCQATPNNVTFKNGTELMLDNRAGVSRSVTFNTKNYTIPAYGFVIVKATSQNFPGITYIDCGSSQNVARILIQE